MLTTRPESIEKSHRRNPYGVCEGGPDYNAFG
jgi:hypothetical protein